MAAIKQQVTGSFYTDYENSPPQIQLSIQYIL